VTTANLSGDNAFRRVRGHHGANKTLAVFSRPVYSDVYTMHWSDAGHFVPSRVEILGKFKLVKYYFYAE
jgi:hypothetical protein